MFGLIAFVLVFVSAFSGSFILYLVAWVFAIIGAAHSDGYRNNSESEEIEKKDKSARQKNFFGNVSMRLLLVSWIAVGAFKVMWR